MAPTTVGRAPSLATFLKSLKQNDIATSIELFISLLRRRQIRNSRQCALATAHLFLRVVGSEKKRNVQALIKRLRDVGSRLIAAQPRELAVGNIVRRVLGVVREVAEDDQDPASMTDAPGSGTDLPLRANSQNSIPTSSQLQQGHGLPQISTTLSSGLSSGVSTPKQRPAISSPYSVGSSLFGLFESADGRSPIGTPPIGFQSPQLRPPKKGQESATKEKLDIKAEVIDGIKELIDELEIVDTQIAESALGYIYEGENILTYTSSGTIQRFLAAAAKKRKFTVFHAEGYPNHHEATHDVIVNGSKKGGDDEDDAEERWKPLTALGIKVVLITDTAVSAVMPRMNKVLLAPHTMFANGGLIAAAGSSSIAEAAHENRVSVLVLGGIYKLSPTFPSDPEELMEYGNPELVVPFDDGEFMNGVEVENPLWDWIAPELVKLYVTNIGAHAPSALYRVVAEHYRAEDIDLTAKDG